MSGGGDYKLVCCGVVFVANASYSPFDETKGTARIIFEAIAH